MSQIKRIKNILVLNREHLLTKEYNSKMYFKIIINNHMITI